MAFLLPENPEEFFSAPSSPRWEQEVGDTTLVQSASSKQLSTNRMDHKKAMELKQQHEEALMTSQTDQIPSQSFGQDSPASISPLSSRSRGYCDSNIASAGNHVTQGGPPSLQQIDNSQPLQESISGSTLPQSSQQQYSIDFQSNSVHRTLPAQRDAKCVSVLSMKLAEYAQPARQDNSIASSLTCDQRARMVLEREKALARRKEKLRLRQQQAQDQNPSRSYMSQCTLADGNVGDLQYDNFVGSSSAQASGCGRDGSSLTSDQQEMGDTILAQSALKKQLSRDRMDHHRAMQLKQQHEEALIASQTDQIPSQSFGQDNLASISPLSSQSHSFCDSNLASAGNHVAQGGRQSLQQIDDTQPSQQSISGSTLPQSSQLHDSSNFQSISAPGTLYAQPDAKHVTVHNMKLADGGELAQHDDCIASSLTCDQRARMAQEKAKALARRNEKLRQCQQQAQDQNHSKSYMSESITADWDALYVADLQRDAFIGSSRSQGLGCGRDGSFLTFDQRARMAQEKEKALARRKEKLQQQQHQALELGCDGSSLTSEQRARMAQEKEKALARRKQKLQQQQAQDQCHNKPSISQCAVADGRVHYFGDSQYNGCVSSHSTLTHEQRKRMAQEKEKALARCEHEELQAKRLCRGQRDMQEMTMQSTVGSNGFFLDRMAGGPSQSSSQTNVQRINRQFEQRCGPPCFLPIEVQNLLEQDIIARRNARR